MNYVKRNKKTLLLFFACKSRGKLGVPEANIEGHRDQFKYCILLSTWRREKIDKIKYKTNQLSVAKAFTVSLYLGVFPCKVSVHLKFWINLILFSCVVPSKDAIKPVASSTNTFRNKKL